MPTIYTVTVTDDQQAALEAEVAKTAVTLADPRPADARVQVTVDAWLQTLVARHRTGRADQVVDALTRADPATRARIEADLGLPAALASSIDSSTKVLEDGH